MINECGGSGGLNIEDLSCLDDVSYDESLCVTAANHSALWNGLQTFALYTELCANGQPVYAYSVYNASLQLEDNGVSEVYYLHFEETKLFSDSDETVKQWLLTKDKISVDYIAVCKEENLLNCVESKWYIESTTYDDNGIDGLLQSVLSQSMTVSNGECGLNDGKDDGKQEGNDEDVIIALVCVFIACALLCAFGCFWYRRNKIRGSVEFKEAKAVKTATTDETETLEVEVEMDVDDEMETR